MALARLFTHLIIVFAGASKSQLRAQSLKHEGEEGAELVKRGLLEQAELDQITPQTGWQPSGTCAARRQMCSVR